MGEVENINGFTILAVECIILVGNWDALHDGVSTLSTVFGNSSG